MYIFTAIGILLTFLTGPGQCCFKMFDRQWKPVSLEERTRKADLVVTANILTTSPIPNLENFYSATFEVINILKGWELLKRIHQEKLGPVKLMEPKIIATASGFGDPRQCFSHVEVGESYALFLSFDSRRGELLTRYDDIFGAADKLFKRTERDILKTLGWEEWSSWSRCSRKCDRGTQRRQRECRKTQTHYTCHGPTEQTRQCNTFSCQKTYDILKFILDHGKSPFSSWQSGEKNVYKNSINQPSPAKAPTYLLIEKFPVNSVIHITFKGPVKNTQFLHSIYDANNRLQFGVVVSRYTFAFTYDKKIDLGTKSRQIVHHTYSFNEDMWYNIALHLKEDEVVFKINCEEEHRAFVNGDLLKDFDVYGQMFLGADKEEEGEKSLVRVQMSSIMVSSNVDSFNKQCGTLLLGSLVGESEGESEEGSGRPGVLSGPEDSESGDAGDNEDGDVDEEAAGSGEKENECRCKNGGVCRKNGVCRCPKGWDGTLCETAICNNRCLNGGECVAPNTCKCKSLTRGSYCQFHECSLPCKNGGVCIGLNTCNCKTGFEGSQCQLETCSKRCLNGGKCTQNGGCTCKKGFKGEYCQFPENCTQFITKMVKYSKPASKIVYFNQEIPCQDNKTKKCLQRRSKSQSYETTGYRQIYVCKESFKT